MTIVIATGQNLVISHTAGTRFVLHHVLQSKRHRFRYRNLHVFTFQSRGGALNCGWGHIVMDFQGCGSNYKTNGQFPHDFLFFALGVPGLLPGLLCRFLPFFTPFSYNFPGFELCFFSSPSSSSVRNTVLICSRFKMKTLSKKLSCLPCKVHAHRHQL